MHEKRKSQSLSGDDGLDEKFVKRESYVFKDAERSETFLQRELGGGDLFSCLNFHN